MLEELFGKPSAEIVRRVVAGRGRTFMSDRLHRFVNVAAVATDSDGHEVSTTSR